jgi:hypothetical protein
MSEQTVSYRVLAAGKEPLHHLEPLQGVFVGCQISSPATFRQSADDIVRALELDILPLSDPHGKDRKRSVIEQLNLGVVIAEAAAKDMKNFSHVGTPLSEDQLAAIHLYSQETDAERNADSGYALVNAALRSEDRNKVQSIKNFIWLLMTGLRLSPKTESEVLYRGVRADHSAQYAENGIITWYQISSCTSRLDILENPLFLGKTGDRTIFSIELASKTRARCIATTLSSVQYENEVLLPPNTRLQVARCGGLPCEHTPSYADATSPRQVVSKVHAGSGLTMVQMKELDSLDPILAFDDPDPVPACQMQQARRAILRNNCCNLCIWRNSRPGAPATAAHGRARNKTFAQGGQDRRTPRAPAAHGRAPLPRPAPPPAAPCSRAGHKGGAKGVQERRHVARTGRGGEGARPCTAGTGAPGPGRDPPLWPARPARRCDGDCLPFNLK